MRRLTLLTSLAIGVSVAAAGDDRAQEEAAAADKFCVSELPHWKLTAGETVLDNPKEPVLRWTNPSAGRVYGNTYLWLQSGRPAAVGCLFWNVQPWNTYNGELAALTGTKLVATRDGKVMWEPKDEWKWITVPRAAAPAGSAAQRLVQMRALAGEFTVELLDTRNSPRGEDETPRLLPRPLYRYDAKQTATFDGALFAFVLGTDPELMVLFECDTAAKKPEWRFGVVRMNRDTVYLKHKGEKVWEAAATRQHTSTDSYLFLGLGSPGKEPRP